MLGRGAPELELAEDARDVLLDRGLRHDERFGYAAVRLPLGHRCEDVALARAQAVQRSGGATTTEHARNHLRIEGAPPAPHPLDRVGERPDLADTLLQEVADALRAVADEFDRVALLIELRQDEHAGLGP